MTNIEPAYHSEEKRSQASGTVYTDGKDATVFYSWQPAQAPPDGWEQAGVLYVIPDETGWRAKARVCDEKWQGVMKQALPHFETKVKELIALLNAAGLGLKDLKAFIESSKQPEVVKELEKEDTVN